MMIEKLAELLNVAQITDDYRGYPDLEISAWNTADGYELTVMTNDHKNIDWEYDVYYYEPDFDTIIDRIKETVDAIPVNCEPSPSAVKRLAVPVGSVSVVEPATSGAANSICPDVFPLITMLLIYYSVGLGLSSFTCFSDV